jgi:chemotaxis protein methyltransferase CheR
LSRDAAAELAELIESVSGVVVPERDLERLGVLAAARAGATGERVLSKYLARLRRDPGWEEWPVLLGRITNKESYLFRGQAQFEALEETILPELASRRPERRLRVWSAGCARGEEAATLAIVLADHPVVADWDWRILATDVDSGALNQASKGIFGRRAVSKVPPAALDCHFTPRGGHFELDPGLRERIDFRPLNLAARSLEVRGGPFDVIFLRNVLIYFRPVVQARVIAGVERELADDGSLFLGASESLFSLASRLDARDLGCCFCYRRRSDAGSGKGAPPPQPDLGGGAEETSQAGPQQDARSLRPGVDQAQLDEGFEEAAAALESEDLARALDTVTDLLRRHPENAVLHALRGLVHERDGEFGEAVRAFRAALYLEPELVEARYLLARSLAEAGREHRAIREYQAVLGSLGIVRAAAPAVLTRLGVPTAGSLENACREALEMLYGRQPR